MPGRAVGWQVEVLVWEVRRPRLLGPRTSNTAKPE